mgnify:CR=1 FL=1
MIHLLTIKPKMMNIIVYFQSFLVAFPQNFEFWAVYESKFDEALISLILWQLLEDGISYLIRKYRRRKLCLY